MRVKASSKQKSQFLKYFIDFYTNTTYTKHLTTNTPYIKHWEHITSTKQKEWDNTVYAVEDVYASIYLISKL